MKILSSMPRIIERRARFRNWMGNRWDFSGSWIYGEATRTRKGKKWLSEISVSSESDREKGILFEVGIEKRKGKQEKGECGKILSRNRKVNRRENVMKMCKFSKLPLWDEPDALYPQIKGMFACKDDFHIHKSLIHIWDVRFAGLCESQICIFQDSVDRSPSPRTDISSILRISYLFLCRSESSLQISQYS